MADETPREHRITTDRDTIREWAEEHDLVPVSHTEGDETTTRFVSRSEAEEGTTMEWDEFHADLGERNRVVVYEETAESGPLSVYDRDEAISRSSLESDAIEASLVEGDVVTSEITETRVVERTIVERAELESELVDTDVLDERVVDVELESRECSNCDVVPKEGTGETAWFEDDDYLQRRGESGMGTDVSVDAGMAPYEAELDVEERYRVTRELTEQFTIETRIADTDVTEIDTLTTEDVDVEGLQQSIVESDLFHRREDDEDRTHVLSEEDVETEFVEGDRIHTFVDRTVTVEDDVVDRKRVRTEVADVLDHEVEVIESRGLETATTSEMDAMGTTIEHGAGETAPARETDTTTDATGTATEGRVTLTEDDEGMDVVDARGEEVGMITEVDEETGVAYVDPHPGITDRIRAVLDIGDADDEDFQLRPERIDRVEDDRVFLADEPTMDEDETV